MSDLATDNPGTVTADNPVTEPAAPGDGTSATSGQAPGAAPATDLFKGVDPNRLPPEVKAHYDSMLRDYREKTAKLSETTKSEIAKATEAYRQKAELYDQIATQDEFVKMWNDYVQKAQAQPGGVDKNGDPILAEMKAQIQQMNEKIQMTEMQQVTEAFAEAVNEKGEKLHPDFDALNEIVIGQLPNGKDAEPFSLLRACIELAQGSPQDKLANGYKMAKAVRDAIFEEGKKAGMGRLQAKVLNGTNPPTNGAGEVLSVTDKKPRNAREAIALAKKGVVVSRD